MMLHEINAGKVVKNRDRKRIGRGESSGQGKTSGRGHKGKGQRAGSGPSPRHEGGRVPYFRSIPKRGFSNFRFRTEFQVVNLGELDRAFEAGQTVDPAALAGKGLIAAAEHAVKILADGKLEKALTVKAHKFSKAAAEAVTAAGGSAEVIK
ncbi:MAG: 50S ribosomal protein L15 [Phycisphaerae bacterium]|nr:50S ribosomal protein L15 [Phycisphaerae bacterium]